MQAVGVAEHVSEERPAIDLAHLRRYTLGNRDIEEEVLQLFASETPHTIEQLARAESDADWQRAAHTLKGTARAVGAWELAERAQEAERLVNWRVQAVRARALASVARAFDDAVVFIGTI
ncbi:MAG: hypothetical protein RLZ98_2870 [Pseudomonadota bacterium]